MQRNAALELYFGLTYNTNTYTHIYIYIYSQNLNRLFCVYRLRTLLRLWNDMTDRLFGNVHGFQRLVVSVDPWGWFMLIIFSQRNFMNLTIFYITMGQNSLFINIFNMTKYPSSHFLYKNYTRHSILYQWLPTAVMYTPDDGYSRYPKHVDILK
jgi:hypothetical protein